MLSPCICLFLHRFAHIFITFKYIMGSLKRPSQNRSLNSVFVNSLNFLTQIFFLFSRNTLPYLSQTKYRSRCRLF